MMITRNHKPIGYGFWLNRRENNMTRISNNHCPSPSSIGSINQLTSIPSIGDNAFNGSRFWTNDGNDSVGRDDITKPDIAIEYNREEAVLTFKINPLLKTIEWQGDQDMIFLVTEYNDPNVLQEMISFNVNELVKYPQRFTLELPEKFSIYTRRIFDKYTYEDTRA